MLFLLPITDDPAAPQKPSPGTKKRASSGMSQGQVSGDHPPPKKRKIGRNNGSGEVRMVILSNSALLLFVLLSPTPLFTDEAIVMKLYTTAIYDLRMCMKDDRGIP